MPPNVHIHECGESHVPHPQSTRRSHSRSVETIDSAPLSYVRAIFISRHNEMIERFLYLFINEFYYREQCVDRIRNTAPR
jgi:hypothetical protein